MPPATMISCARHEIARVAFSGSGWSIAKKSTSTACYHRFSARPRSATSLAHSLRWRHLRPSRAHHRSRTTARIAEAAWCRSDDRERRERRWWIRNHSSDCRRAFRTRYRRDHHRQSRLGQARDHRLHELGERKRGIAGPPYYSSRELSRRHSRLRLVPGTHPQRLRLRA